MKKSFTKYPVDIILCMIWSLILLPLIFFDIESQIRVIIGLPFILFIPGYLLVFALFPTKKTEKGIDSIERIALSFGLSIAIVPLIGLGLNYTPFGIRLMPIFLSIFIFIIGVGTIAMHRWLKTDVAERFIISINLSRPTFKNKLDKFLTYLLVIAILIAVASLIYVIITPKQGEQFTEFYLLGPEGIAEGYPKDLSYKQHANIIIGVVNHEYETITYTIEIWLINQTTSFNETENKNITKIDHIWFLDKLVTTLNHINVDIEQPWTPQWEKNYTLTLYRRGSFKLAFLLFKEPREDYVKHKDYNDIADQILNSAYRELHLFLNVT